MSHLGSPLGSPLGSHRLRPAILHRCRRASYHLPHLVIFRRNRRRRGRPGNQRLAQRRNHPAGLPMCPRHLLVKCHQRNQVAHQARGHLIIPACSHLTSQVPCPRLSRRLHRPEIPHRIRQAVRRRFHHLYRASSLLRGHRVFRRLCPATILRRFHLPSRVMCRPTLPLRSRRRHQVTRQQMSQPVRHILCLRAVQVRSLPMLLRNSLQASQL